MAEYDLVVRNTTIATAADVVKGDIGISAGRVVALGERLDRPCQCWSRRGFEFVKEVVDILVHCVPNAPESVAGGSASPTPGPP
jgi:dihydropyrimidinase